MFCTNCGKQIADDSNFCSFCAYSTNSYHGYHNDLKEFCQFQDKYRATWLLAGEYTEKINKYYYNYINYNNHEDFDNLLIYCLKYIDLLPKLEEANREDHQINGTPLIDNSYCVAYHKLAMAYEKSGCYNSAINVCNEAIARHYTDGTKGGFKARIKRIQKKQDEIENKKDENI